ncbi:hypothetical protein F5Y11DRAFT_348774 [Daldinia sp. FL1419]|nr:hypothetical protein F5Y11DRAFT_348774 [Daldinia sp. FL1419]
MSLSTESADAVVATSLKNIGDSSIDVPRYTLVFTAVCLLPTLFVIVAVYFRGKETTAHSFLAKGLRMFAIGFGYIIIGIFSLPIFCLHYVDNDSEDDDDNDVDLENGPGRCVRPTNDFNAGLCTPVEEFKVDKKEMEKEVRNKLAEMENQK